MRIQSKALIGGLAAWYCAAALSQSTGNSGGAQGAQGTPATSQTNPTPASTPAPTPASQPNPTPASNSTPTPASTPTPTPSSPATTRGQNDQRQNDQTQFPSSNRQRQDDNIATGGQQQPQLSRCAALTGIPKAECERRDAPNTENLPAGVTPAQAERQAQREAAAARDNTPRPNAADTMRSPPPSTVAPPATITPPPPTAPAPSSTSREDADTLDRPR